MKYSITLMFFAVFVSANLYCMDDDSEKNTVCTNCSSCRKNKQPKKTQVTRFKQIKNNGAYSDGSCNVKKEKTKEEQVDDAVSKVWRDFLGDTYSSGKSQQKNFKHIYEYVLSMWPLICSSKDGEFTEKAYKIFANKSRLAYMSIGFTCLVRYCFKRLNCGDTGEDFYDEKIPARIIALAIVLYDRNQWKNNQGSPNKEIKDELNTSDTTTETEIIFPPMPTSFSIDRVSHRLLFH
jgi:hypothetical protein